MVEASPSVREVTEAEWTVRDTRRESERTAAMMPFAGGHATLGGDSGYGRGKKCDRMEGTMDINQASLSSFGTKAHNITNDGLPRYASTMQKDYGMIGVPNHSRDDGSGPTARALDNAHPDSGGVWLGTRWEKPRSKRGLVKPFVLGDPKDPRLVKWHGAPPPRRTATEAEMRANCAERDARDGFAGAQERAELAELRGMGIGDAAEYKAAMTQWLSSPEKSAPAQAQPPPTPPESYTLPWIKPAKPAVAPEDDLSWVTTSSQLRNAFNLARSSPEKERPNPVPPLSLSEMATQHLNPATKIKVAARKAAPIRASG